MSWPRLFRALFVAYVVATLVHIGWTVAHEPFFFDAWNVAADTHGRPFSPEHFLAYWRLEYTHSNPRLGQVLAYFAYKLDPFATIATPLAYLSISLSITVLALRRWPLRQDRDLALWAFVIGALWFALPEVGKTMFCRSYAANYVYGCAIQLLFLLPVRLSTSGRAGLATCVGYAVLGVAAGMCNEHTGPTLIALLVVRAVWLVRARGERPTLVFAGMVGFALGFAAILFAPGQGERYGGLAERAGLFATVVRRGVTGNLGILCDLLVAAAPVLALVAIVLVITARDKPEDGSSEARCRALRLLGIAMLASVAMAATLFASPKLGSRFYLVACCLLLVGLVALVDAVLATPRRLIPLVALAVFSSGYAAARTVPLYAGVKRASDARLAGLEQSRRGQVFFADAFRQVEESWWFYGDDLRDWEKRQRVATYFDLGGVVLRAYDPRAPLAVSTARLVPRVRVSPPGCGDAGAFALGEVRGLDVAGLQREVKVAVAVLRERLGDPCRLDELELAVQLADSHAALPRARILVGRWTPDRYEGYASRLVGTTGEVVLPAELRSSGREIYVYRVGDEAKRIGTARDAHLHYGAWGEGVYWVLACDRDNCFVLAATRHGS